MWPKRKLYTFMFRYHQDRVVQRLDHKVAYDFFTVRGFESRLVFFFFFLFSFFFFGPKPRPWAAFEVMSSVVAVFT